MSTESPVQASATVRARTQQAYDLHLNISLLPSAQIPVGLMLSCQPRQGAQRMTKDALDLPEATRSVLQQMNKDLVAWLAQSDVHAQAFIADPMRALAQAGIVLERSHLKAISRLREANAQAQAVVPGLQMRSVSVAASRTGTVPVVDKAHGDCGCSSNYTTITRKG